MKRIFLLVLASVALNAQADERNVVNEASEYLIEQSAQLFLMQNGDFAPRQDDDGSTTVNFMSNKSCASETDCNGLLLSYRQSNLNECLKPNLTYRFDELPVTLSQNYKGIFTVPSITEPSAMAHDYLVFFSNKTNTCYEFAWGNAGENFDKHLGLANHLINSGY